MRLGPHPGAKCTSCPPCHPSWTICGLGCRLYTRLSQLTYSADGRSIWRKLGSFWNRSTSLFICASPNSKGNSHSLCLVGRRSDYFARPTSTCSIYLLGHLSNGYTSCACYRDWAHQNSSLGWVLQKWPLLARSFYQNRLVALNHSFRTPRSHAWPYLSNLLGKVPSVQAWQPLKLWHFCDEMSNVISSTALNA